MSDLPAYRIRRSERARRVRVTVDPVRGVEVVLPRRAAESQASAAVAQLRPWIERRLAEQARQRQAIAARGDRVPYLDEVLELVAQPGRRRAHRVGQRLLVPPDGPDRLPALERFYRRAARQEVALRLDRACAAAGLGYRALAIRGQRTRWASCSRNGTMSFNWRLLLAPERVLDYVVWHEVCHLTVMDHSPRFWALLSSHCPGFEEPRRWLTRHGGTLALA